jgi:hypothetical protein
MPLFSQRMMNSLAAPQGRAAQTFDGTAGSISTAQKKFGNSSHTLQGISSERFTTTGHDDSNFTLEGWFRFSGIRSGDYSGSFFGGNNASIGNTAFALSLFQNSVVTLQNRNSSNTDFVLGISLATNTWYHVALTVSSSTAKLYINGTQRGGNRTLSGPFLSSGDKLILGSAGLSGTWPNTTFGDEYRLSKTLRYDGSFTEPSAAFVNDANTVLLCHCEAYPLVDDNA